MLGSFRSRLLERLMGGLFDKAVRKYADAFEARADAVYGAGPALLASQHRGKERKRMAGAFCSVSTIPTRSAPKRCSLMRFVPISPGWA